MYECTRRSQALRGHSLILFAFSLLFFLVVWWSVALALAAVTLTLGNKWIMHDFHFPLSLLLVQNGTAVIVILIAALVMKLNGKSRMERFTTTQVLIVLGSAAISTLQLSASLIALPHISIATLTVFGNGR